MDSKSVKLAYRQDKTLEIHLDTTDVFLDGRRGRFPSPRHRDFLLEVAKKAPKTATFHDLEAAVRLGKQESRDVFKRLAFQVKDRLEQLNLRTPVLESVKSMGYTLADGWHIAAGEVKSKHLAYDLLRTLTSALHRAGAHVDKTPIVANAIGLAFVERTETTRQLAKDNYTIIEDVGWQLIHVLSSCGIANDEHPDVLEVKKKLEKLISYALFWRIGDSITEDKFRRDFHSETRKLMSEFKGLIERILEISEARKLGRIPPLIDEQATLWSCQ